MPTGVQISGLTFLNFVNTDVKIPIQLTGTTYHIDYSAITDNIRVQGLNSSAPGNLSNAEGNGTIATGDLSHSEGEGTESIGASSHAEGDGSKSYGGNSHAEGALTIASGISSHSEGYQTKSVGDYSHSEGYGTVSEHNYQSVTGLFNTTGVTTSDDIFVIGNGTDIDNRSDLFIANLTGITINGGLTVTGVTSMVSRVVTNISIGTAGNFYVITSAGDYYVDSCNSGGVDNFVQFPSAVPLVGQQILIVNRVGDTFDVSPFGGESIYQKADVSASFSTMTPRSNATFKSDGVGWYQVA